MPSFGILHISDLHCSETPSHMSVLDYAHLQNIGKTKLGNVDLLASHDPDMLQALAVFAWENSEEYDVILITGDLATIGSEQDLRTAYRFVNCSSTKRTLMYDIDPTLGFLHSRKMAILPGNHDRFHNRPLFLPGNTDFDCIFQKYWKAGQGVQTLWVKTKDNCTLALIGADFTIAKNSATKLLPLMHLGCGCIYPQRLDKLILETRHAKEIYPNCTVLWAIHFMPCSTNDELQLFDDKLLIDAVEKEYVPAILCGHTHISHYFALSEKTNVYVCGTSTQYSSSSGNYLHYLDVEVYPNNQKPPVFRLVRFKFTNGGFVKV